jgi:hypothetical protein
VKATHDKKGEGPSRYGHGYWSTIFQFIAAHSPKPKLRRDGRTKPLQNFVKLNVDASSDADDLRGTTGVVIRDSYENFVVVSNSKLEFVYDVLSVELDAT